MAPNDVKLKHKVQLKTKVAQQEEEPITAVEEPQSTETKGKSLTWLWILLALIVVAGLVWWFTSSKDETAQEPAAQEQVEEVAEEVTTEEAVPAEEATEATEATEGPGNGDDQTQPSVPEVKPETETPADANAPAANNPATSQSTSKAVTVSGDVEAEAMKVIRGDYGIGQERKDKLGESYQSIQNRVNELKRQGVF